MTTNKACKNKRSPVHDFAEIATSRLVTITVKGGKEYYIHQLPLIKASKYFSKALEGSFKEALEKKIHLNTVESDTFERFVSWLYTGTFKTSEFKKNNYSDKSEDWNDYRIKAWEKVYLELLNLYIFAHGHAINGLPNDIVDQFGTYMEDTDSPFPSKEVICLAVSSLPTTSGLLRLLVDDRCRWLWEEEDHEDSEFASQLPHEYLAQLFARVPVVMYRVQQEDNPREMLCLNMEDYHDHSEDEEH